MYGEQKVLINVEQPGKEYKMETSRIILAFMVWAVIIFIFWSISRSGTIPRGPRGDGGA